MNGAVEAAILVVLVVVVVVVVVVVGCAPVSSIAARPPDCALPHTASCTVTLVGAVLGCNTNSHTPTSSRPHFTHASRTSIIYVTTYYAHAPCTRHCTAARRRRCGHPVS